MNETTKVRSETQEKVLGLLLKGDPLLSREIAQSLGLGATSIHNALLQLYHLGLASGRKTKGGTLWYVKPSGADAVDVCVSWKKLSGSFRVALQLVVEHFDSKEFSCSEFSERTNYDSGQARDRLSYLYLSGYLNRTTQRGGYVLAYPELIAHFHPAPVAQAPQAPIPAVQQKDETAPASTDAKQSQHQPQPQNTHEDISKLEAEIKELEAALAQKKKHLAEQKQLHVQQAAKIQKLQTKRDRLKAELAGM